MDHRDIVRRAAVFAVGAPVCVATDGKQTCLAHEQGHQGREPIGLLLAYRHISRLIRE